MPETKNKKTLSRKYGALLGLAFLSVLLFGASGVEAACTCYCDNPSDGTSDTLTVTATTDAACRSTCNSGSGCGTSNYQGYAFTSDDGTTTATYSQSEGEKIAASVKTEVETTCGAAGTWAQIAKGNIFSIGIKWLLWAILRVFIWILGIAVILFKWMVDPDNINFIMTNDGIYASWAMVRDFLNLGFILSLLYVAFCVVFQIGSYSDGWNKILLMMVIMALLVNFSFPICRFIVDVSNIIFYYLFNSAFPGADGENVMVQMYKGMGMEAIFNEAQQCSADVTFVLAAIAFAALMAITFMVIGVMFIIRLVALGILAIFAPIGFVGVALPFKKLNTYASEWWDELFKYSFFAPIMMFMIIVAVKVMNFMGSQRNSMAQVGTTVAGVSAPGNFIGMLAFCSIPLVILWTGLIYAQKSGTVGAGMVAGAGMSVGKWAGKKFSGYNAVMRNYAGYKAARKKRDEAKEKKNLGSRLGGRLNNWQDTQLARFPGSRGDAARKRLRDANRQDIEDDSKKLIEVGISVSGAVAGMQAADARGDTKEAAVHARAYLKQDGDDRKNYVENQARSAGGGALSGSLTTNAAAMGITNAQDAADYEAARNRAMTAQAAIQAGGAAGNGVTDQHKKDLHAFVNDYMKRRVQNEVNRV